MSQPSIERADPDAATARPVRSGVPNRRRRVPLADIAVIAVYAALAVICYGELWSRSIGHVYLYENDAIQTMWFLNWIPYALGHGLNPLHSSLVNVPHGINLLDQTSSPLLGLVLSPVTVLFGATASFNLGETLALAGSAISMYFVVRRFVAWRPAAFIAGLLYGFGPYEIGQGTAHLNLSFCVLPPIVLLLVHDVATRVDGRSRRHGIALGLLLVGQFFISTEVFVTTAMAGVLIVLVVGIRGHRRFRDHLHGTTVGFGWALGVAIVVLAYPAWYALAGPEHVNGPLQVTAQYRADLLGPVVPDGLMRIAPASFVNMANVFAGNWSENGSYLGIPMLAVLLAGAVWLRRRAEVQLAVIVGVVFFVCSLGPRLVVRSAPMATAAGAPIGRIPLPWDLVSRLPVFRNILPARLSLFVGMAAALLLAVIVDRLRVRVNDAGGVRAVVPAGVAVVALVPVIPAVPYDFARPVPTSTYFASRFAAQLPPGRTVLLYPYPSAAVPAGALWQTQADMRFSFPGGYFLVPQGPGGTVASSAIAINTFQTVTGTALSELSHGESPPRSAALRSAVHSELHRWRVGSVVAVPGPGTARPVVAYLSWLLGESPVRQADAYVWYHLSIST